MIYTKTVNHQITTNVQLILFDVDKSGVFFSVVSFSIRLQIKFPWVHQKGVKISLPTS